MKNDFLKERIEEVQKLIELESERKRRLNQELSFCPPVRGDSCNTERRLTSQALNEAKVEIRNLQYQLRELKEEEKREREQGHLNRSIKVMDLDEKVEERYRVVTSECLSNPEIGLITRNTPLAKALIGREVGEEVRVKVPGGERRLKILNIEG